MATVPRLISYEEWLRMPNVGEGADEVVRGEYRAMPPTRFPHAQIIRNLIRRFDAQLDETKATILGSNFGLLISREPLTCRSPDLALYWLSGVGIEDGLYTSPPDLIIEVLSPSENRRRKLEKLDDYASIAVPEVWVLSPEAESVEIHILEGGQFLRKTIAADGSLEPVRFPGVKVVVTTVWAG